VLDMPHHCFIAVHGGDEGYGNALLSRFPISRWRTKQLPEPRGDTRIIIAAQLDTPKGPLWVCVTHLDHQSEPVRLSQLRVALPCTYASVSLCHTIACRRSHQLHRRCHTSSTSVWLYHCWHCCRGRGRLCGDCID
jgi:endonuclease/exonuclease/phosphatase family metal-dependent hydrolase